MSKTLPIWCCVINRAVRERKERAHLNDQARNIVESGGEADSPDDLKADTVGIWDEELYLPASIVSPSERDQIEKRIEGWVEELLTSSYTVPDVPKPLRPVWIAQPPHFYNSLRTEADLDPTSLASYIDPPPDVGISSPEDLPFHPIVCISASVPYTTLGLDEERRGREGYTYIQGAGDDHESWSLVSCTLL